MFFRKANNRDLNKETGDFRKSSIIIASKCTDNGINTYSFYKKNEKICTVTCGDSPEDPVKISTNVLSWESEFEAGTTLYPGVVMRVLTEGNVKREVCKMIYRDTEKYEIVYKTRTIIVTREDGDYIFTENDEKTAIINDIYNTQMTSSKKEDIYQGKPYYEIRYKEDVEERLLYIIMSFPMLNGVA